MNIDHKKSTDIYTLWFIGHGCNILKPKILINDLIFYYLLKFYHENISYDIFTIEITQSTIMNQFNEKIKHFSALLLFRWLI